MVEAATANQRRTLAARQALARKLESPQEKKRFYTDLGKRSAERRIILSSDELTALGEAYELLRRIAQRAKASSTDPPPEKEMPAGGDPAGREAA